MDFLGFPEKTLAYISDPLLNRELKFGEFKRQKLPLPRQLFFCRALVDEGSGYLFCM